MGCHLDPAVMYCYVGNVELVLAVLVGLKGHTFMKGCGQGGAHDSNSTWYLFRIPMIHRYMTSHTVRPRTSLERVGNSNLTSTVSFRR